MGAAGERISVVRGDQRVPLFADAGSKFAKVQPWKGVLLERHSVRPSEIPEHVHHEFCLHLQVSGDADFEWWSEGKNRIEKTAPGALILLPPGTRDRLRWEGHSERVVVSIASELLMASGEELGAVGPEFAARWALQSAGLRTLVAEMGREAAAGWPLGSLYADLLSVSLRKQLLMGHAVNPALRVEAKGGLPMARLRQAMEYLHARLGEDVRLEDAAAAVGLSSFHFAHQFRGSTGQTPYQYLLDLRMERAKVLLRSTVWPVQEIGAAVGFKSAVNFVRAFRQRMGVTPGEWRARG